MEERIKTFIQGMDSLIEGGLPKGAIVLVCGTPGTGKSILCSQILFQNAAKGKKCLYLNLEQDEGRLEKQIRQFGWDLDKVKENLKIVSVDSSSPDMVGFVLSEIQKLDYDLIALDSLDSISSTPLEGEELGKMGADKIADSVIPVALDTSTIGRLKLKKIFTAIAKSKATALLTTEKVENAPGLSRDTISEFLCDGIVLLKALAVGKTFNRTLQVAKMRFTEADCSIKSFSITKKGVELQ